MSGTVPTRRGWAVVGVVVVALAMGWGFGGRSLNAVIVPGVVALALMRVILWRVGDPRVVRSVPEHGFRGDTVDVRFAVETRRSSTGRLEVTYSDGLDGPTDVDVVTDGRPIEATVTLAARGTERVGGYRVTLGDALGLWRRTVEVGITDRITVYPRIHRLSRGDSLLGRVSGEADDREHFDGVREYTPGDPLRDVNWKTSARLPTTRYVTEYAGTGTTEAVTIGVEAGRGGADDAAEAAASVAAYLLDTGAPVGVVVPGRRLDPAVGDVHRRAVLSLLAAFDGGRLDESAHETADVIVSSPGKWRGVEVAVGDERRPFDRLAGPTPAGGTA